MANYCEVKRVRYFRQCSYLPSRPSIRRPPAARPPAGPPASPSARPPARPSPACSSTRPPARLPGRTLLDEVGNSELGEVGNRPAK